MSETESSESKRRNLIYVLCGAAFLIFFQAFMVAPLIPHFSGVFGTSVEYIGLIVPAYLVTYGAATLVYGPLSDHMGYETLILASMTVFIVLIGVTGLINTAESMIILRLLTGLGASAVVPLSLALIGDLYEYGNRGQALGWLFAAMQGGMAAGSTSGAVLEPFIGWQWLFFGSAIFSIPILVGMLYYRSLLRVDTEGGSISVGGVAKNYLGLLSTGRGRRTYGFVFLNAIIHSGVYTWLGLYFSQQFGLGEIGIGLAILGYGVPGFFLGPVIGRYADKYGRKWFIPVGLAIAGVSILGLAVEIHVLVAALLVATLSLGYDTTQPLFAGIVTDLSDDIGLAMGLNVFALFAGFGFGALVFAGAMQLGLETALVVFGLVMLVAATVAAPLFREEDESIDTAVPG
jgi:predicted MFS family arabinose efflux permease